MQRCLAAMVFMALATLGSAAANPKRVLILNPFGRDTEPFTAAVSAFRATLGRERSESIVFDEVPLDLGLGPVGARLFQNSGIGAQAVVTALRILRGEKANRIPPEILAPATPVYDWRELRRWRIPEARLPAGSLIRFRQQTFWERYRWPAIGVIGLGLLQAALIAGLLVNRKKRRQSEAEATLIAEISSKFVNLPAHDVDREIMDAQRRICETLDLGISALWQWSAAETGFLTLTHIYQADGGPKPPDRMDAEEYFPWHRQHMAAGRVTSFSSLDELPAEATRDRETMRHFNIKSNLTLPLSVGGEPPIGALGFNATRKERVWSPELIKRLRMIAQIFTTALARKRADQALRESELRLSLAAESADAGMWVLDWATQVFWFTDKAREIFRFSPGETIHMDRFKQVIHTEDIGRIESVISESIRTGKPLDVEYRVRLADGSQRWVASRGRPIYRENGRPERLLGLSMDITARKQNEEKARVGEARLAAGFNLAGLGYYEFDFEKNTCFIDGRFHEICGIPAGHHVAAATLDHWMGSVFPADLELVMSENQKLHDATTDRVSLHHRYVHPQEGVKWLHHFSGVSARATDGTVLRTHGVIRDVTEQRNAESVTEELRNELSHSGRVTLLGQLASALAHELSQPLGAILRNAEAAEIMLKEASPDIEELRAIIDDILRDDHRAGDVINKLRSLLKKGRLDLQPIDLPEVVTEVLTLIRSDAVARNVDLSLTAAPGIPMLRGDRIHLQQVLLNLIVNAMDALGSRPPDARSVQVHVGLLAASKVEVRVCDNGPGISKEHLADLFDPFFTTKPAGMGMGLAVSKTIVEAHGGKILAANRPEGGTCFSFTLPTAHHA